MKPTLGVCYYPEHWHEDLWHDDAKRMIDTGISWVRIGEFAWGSLEKKQGEFTWDWLDKSVDILGNAGLKIIMGTPSATPPRWIIKQYPDMLAVDANNNIRDFGSRRHYCFSHVPYRIAAAKMAQKMAMRYGDNPYIFAWQIDNEYGCHDTIISYSNVAKMAFRQWLANKYATIDALNTAWGNIFWSMDYNDFDDINLPNLTVTEANPSHRLDFRRFSSDQVVAFNQAQIDAMRPYIHTPLIHNYMGRITAFDHFAVGENLDIASWDSYPLGFLEQVLDEESDDWKQHFATQGDPDFQAFHHDLYRAVGKGRWWVMEQQPGPVNWARYNPIPRDGMVKLWGMEAIAHGAEVVSYFRWRQAPFAQEQFHAGLLHVNNDNARGQSEVSELAQELEKIGDIEHKKADIAIIFDYESQWAWEIQPQGESFDYFRLVFEQYRALRQLGVNIDFLPSNINNFGDYKFIIIPALMAWNDALRTAIDHSNAIILAGPRTGLKTENMAIPQSLGPDFANTKTLRVATMRPNKTIDIPNGGKVTHWYEELTSPNIVEKDCQGNAILTRQENHYYLGAWLDNIAYMRIFGDLCHHANIITTTMPMGLRQRHLKDRTLVLNYNLDMITWQGNDINGASYIWL